MIAFLISSLETCGGTQKQLLKLLDYADRQSVPFIIVTNFYDESRTYPGFSKYKNRIYVLNVPFFSHQNIFKRWISVLKIVLRLRKLLKGIGIVNIHDCGFEKYFWAFPNDKMYWQINDLPGYFNIGVNQKTKNKGVFLKKMLLKFSLKKITRITVNVSKNKERVKKYLKRDAEVFYCGIEPVGVKRNMQETVERFMKKQINLLTSGVFFEYRNYETQVCAVKKLKDAGYKVHLNIIGATTLSPNYTEKIRSLIRNYNLNDEITICGQISDDDFKKLHCHSDIFVFLNIDQSWGLSIFEAMSCGIPVIVSKSVGATEILSNQENAVFVDPINIEEIEKQVQRLATDIEFYMKISKKAQLFCNKYTWDETYCSKMLAMMLQ